MRGYRIEAQERKVVARKRAPGAAARGLKVRDQEVVALMSHGQAVHGTSYGGMLALQRLAGNRAVSSLLGQHSAQQRRADGDALDGGAPAGPVATSIQGSAASTVQRLGQDLPFIGPLLSYLNPINQALRLVLPGLSPEQKSLLDGIFGSSLATSILRLNPNSVLASGNCYRTTGSTINMPGTTIDDRHLIHEATHAWQSQNTLFGVGYAISALKSMLISQLIGGDWEQAYDYSQVERLHIPWRYWNAEQQAHWIEDHRCLPSGWMIQGMLPDFEGLVESSGH